MSAVDLSGISADSVSQETIRDRLLAPLERCDLRELVMRWFHTDIVWRIEGLGRLATDPGLAGRLRGAFGKVLLQAASSESRSGLPCPWQPPCAFEVLFRKQGRMQPGLDFPSPWLFLVDPARNGDLLVTLRLFGFAVDYAPAASEALQQALTMHADLGGRLHRAPSHPRIVDRQIRPGNLRDVDRSRLRGFSLTFLSPVALTGKSVFAFPHSLLTTLPLRLAGLARWMDLDLTAADGFRDAVLRLSLEWFDPQRQDWVRGSFRQHKQIPMSGHGGLLKVSGEPEDLAMVADALALGEASFCGADVAFGLGRYRLTPEHGH